jgi:iron complex outermembrane receptor protein
LPNFLKDMKPQLIKTLFTGLLLLACINFAFAQGGAKVSGLLQDAQGKALDYATVTLLKQKDSTAVAGTLTTETGAYVFGNVKTGSYYIKVTNVGYETTFSQQFIVGDSSKAISIPL